MDNKTSESEQQKLDEIDATGGVSIFASKSLQRNQIAELWFKNSGRLICLGAKQLLHLVVAIWITIPVFYQNQIIRILSSDRKRFKYFHEMRGKIMLDTSFKRQFNRMSSINAY